jgi:hypothetical protein
MSSAFGTIIQIGDILVSEEVALEYFACDYATCRGACCIYGDSGAPMDESELPGIERDYPLFSHEMLEAGRNAVDANGFFEIDREGDIVTPLVPGSEACAYAHFTADGACMCAIELCGCRKPQSCSLYPIRVTKLTGGGLALNLHRWDICKCAFEKGRREGIRVYQFLKGPLTRAYGEEFYAALEAGAAHVIGQESTGSNP